MTKNYAEKAFHIFTFVLIFSPLAFGTVETWSLFIMEASIFLALLLFLLNKTNKRNIYIYKTPGIMILFIFLIYIFVQVIPFPPEVIKLISSKTYNLYNETVYAAGVYSWLSLSINKKATILELLRFTSYFCFYFLTVQLLSDRDRLKKLVLLIVLFAAFISFFSLLQHITSNNRIYWLRELTKGGNLFGPFVNRNHYAGLMEMLFPIVLSLFLYYKPITRKKRLREQFTELFNINETNVYLLLGLSAVLIGTSIFLSLSRTGIVSLCLSMIVFGSMLVSRTGNKKRGFIIIVVCILIILAVGWFGWQPIIERFEKIRGPEGDISEQRLVIWKDSVKVIRDFFVTGVGFGNFINIYPGYRSVPGDAVAEHSHNDYIELLIDGGVIGFVLYFIFLFVVLFKSFKVYLRRKELYAIYLYTGGITGIFAILIHSFTDFNMHIGSNGLYFFFLAGLCVVSANTRLREGLENFNEKIELSIKFIRLPLILLIILTCIFYSGIIAGEIFYKSIKDERLGHKNSAIELEKIKKSAYMAYYFDPMEARYAYAVANVEKLLSNNKSAYKYYKRAVFLLPTNGEYLQRLGLIMSELKDYENSEILMKAGIKYNVINPERYKRYALWLISMGRKDEGLKIMKESINLEPSKTREYIALMVLSGLNDEEIGHSIPEKVEPVFLFADYLTKIGKGNMADEMFKKALNYLKADNKSSPSYYFKICSYYEKKGLYEDAISILKDVKRLYPENQEVYLMSGRLYEKMGLMDKAVEEYRDLLLKDPGNKQASKRIKDIMSNIK